MKKIIKKILDNLEKKMDAEILWAMQNNKEEEMNGVIDGLYTAIEVVKQTVEKYISTENINCSTNASNDTSTNGWIPCSERLPEEHETMFAKLKGTDKWDSAMPEKISDDVNVTVEFEDGTRKTKTMHTIDGKWKTDINIVKFNVIAWQPLPEPYKESE